ncbi:MAG: tetratricopeptide repeat protein [Deltaproteobacteria bacterium]|nr:tetratricopeptide repeat protein [Deltaproteobacteria bacterium]
MRRHGLERALVAVAVLAPLAACGPATWSDALREAEASGSTIARAELAFVAGRDAERGLGLALEVLAGADPASPDAARAIALALETSRALGELEKPLDHLARVLGATRDPGLAARLTPEVERYWARLDGRPADGDGAVAAALARVIAMPGAAWEPARAEARRQRITARRLSEGTASARDAAAEAGFVVDWRLSAPWGRSPELDLDRPLGPETRALADAERTGAGWDLVARPTTRATFSDGEVTFFDLAGAGGVGFAEATITIPGGGPARLRVETNRRLIAFVGGREVIARRSVEDPWRAATDLDLPPEGTRLTVKLASPDGTGFFRVQVSPIESGATSAAPGAPDHPAGRVATGDAAAVVTALSELDALVSRPRLDIPAARRALGALERTLGPHPAVDLLAARLARIDARTPAATQRQEARDRLERALATWPGNPVATRALARLEKEEDRADQALALLVALPSDARTLLERLEIQRARGWEAEALASAEGLRAIPGLADHSPRVLAELVDQARAFGRIASARADAEALDRRFPGLGATRRAELAQDSGDRLLAADLYGRAFAAEPERHALLRSRIAALRADGAAPSLALAVEALAAFLEARPHDAWALAERARVALQMGRRAAAVKLLDDVLAAHPDFAPVEGLLAALAGRPQPLEAEAWQVDGPALLAAYRRSDVAAAWAAYPVVAVHDRTLVDVRADGSTVELQHRVRLVQTRAGADALGDFRPPDGARLLIARTLKADGRVLHPERTEGKADLSFPELQAGDAVETAWVVRSRVSPSEGGYLTGVSFAGWSAPTWRHASSFHVAPGLALVATRFGGAPEPRVERLPDGSRTWAWGGGDSGSGGESSLPAVPREPLAVSARSFFPFADVRIVRSDGGEGDAWAAIAETFASRLGRVLAPGRRVDELARRLGTPAAAFSWVKTDLEDVEQLNLFETPAETAIAAGKGHRAVVLAALVRAMGSGADIWLCAPERDGPPEDRASPTPNANRFFYPLVALDGGRTLLDPSRAWMPWDAVPAELAGTRCLVPERVTARGASSDGTSGSPTLFAEVRPLDPRAPPSFDLKIDVVVRPDGDAVAKVIGLARGVPSVALRQLWQNMDEARRTALWEQWAAEIVLGARVVGSSVEDAGEAERPMRFELDLEIPGFAAIAGDEVRSQKAFSSLVASSFASVPPLSQMTSLPERRTPLRIAPHTERVVLHVVLPAGFVVDEPPASFERAIGPHRLAQEVAVDGGRVVIEREVRLVPGRVEPSDYAELRRVIDEAEREMTAPIRGVRR